MSHQSVKLIPGINQNRTPTLNEAGISTSNLVRFLPDDQGKTLIQKLGGWVKFYSGQIQSTVRALWAWEDTNANQFLGLGAENSLSVILGVSPNGTNLDITPQDYTANIDLAVQTTAGSSIATVTDIGSNIFTFDTVNVLTQFYVGGLTFAGTYPVYDTAGSDNYQIQSVDLFGNPSPAIYDDGPTQYQVLATTGASGNSTDATLTFAGPVTFPSGSTIVVAGMVPTSYNGIYTVGSSSSTSVTYPNSETGAQTQAGVILGGPALPYFTTTNASASVRVIFPQHGLGVGSTFSCLTPTAVGGLTIYGNFIVQSVADANTFTIVSTNTASSSDSSFMNGGKASFQYFIGKGQLPTSSGYGVGGYGAGGYGTGATPSAGRTFTTTAASGDGATATLSFSGDFYIPPGSTITVTGMTPSGYNTPINGYAVVTKCLPGSTTTINYYNTTLGPQTVPGTITIIDWVDYSFVGSILATATSGTGQVATVTISGSFYVPAGYFVTISGVVPSSYNGTFLVISSSIGGGSTTISFASNATGSMTLAGPVQIYDKAPDWSLDNWGDILIASPVNGPIYQWYYISGQKIAEIIPQAPTVNEGLFVAMPQRQIIAWGSTFTGVQDPLLIRWCDVNNFNVWIGQVSNQAGSYRIPRGSKIVGGLQVPQQALVWTDLAVWSMQYIGPPYVYSFNQIGTGCGLIARKAAGSLNNIVYWMGQTQFYKLDGNGVSPIYCPVWDVIFQDLDKTNLDKIRCAPNSRFSEIAWYYPTTTSGGEVSKYVKYNIAIDKWDFGTLARTAWINESVLGAPIGTGFTSPVTPGPINTSQYVYQHETSPDADGQAMTPSFQTGYFALSDGDQKMFIDEVWPDFKFGYYGGAQSANIQMTFYGADFPEQTPVVYGPYNITSSTTFFNPRIRARLLAIQVSSSDIGSFWRLGDVRYRGQPDGRY